MALDDRQLITRIRAGDDDAFEVLAARQRPGLVRHARGKLGGRTDEAEDVVQEALIKAMRALRQGAEPANPSAWLRVIVARCAYDLHDADRRRPSVPMLEDVHADLGLDPQSLVEERGEVERTVAAIVSLPTAQRDAIVGYELEGLTYDELGAEHGWSVPATKSLLWRARTTLAAERRKWAAAVTQPIGAVAALRDWLGHLADKPTALMAGHMGGDAISCVAAVALTAVAAAAPLASSPVSRAPAREQAAEKAPALVAAAPVRRVAAAPRAAAVVPAAARHVAVAPGLAAAASSSAAASAVPAAGSADAGAVLRACAASDAPLEGYTPSALARARREMPNDVQEYTDCGDRVSQALLNG